MVSKHSVLSKGCQVAKVRKILSILISAALAFCLMPSIASAQEACEADISVAASTIDIAQEVDAILYGNDTSAEKTVVEGLSSPEEANELLSGLSNEYLRHVAIDAKYEPGNGIVYSIIVHAQALWGEGAEDSFSLQSNATFAETMREAWENLATSIDVSNFGLTEDSVWHPYLKTIGDTPSQFNVRTWWSYSTDDLGVMQVLTPHYCTDDPAQYAEWKKTYEANITEAIATVPENVTQLAKVVILNRWICRNLKFNYDYNWETTPEVWTSLGAMVMKSAVCQGLSLAYQDMLTRVGVECDTLFVFANDHVWNMVNVDGLWYHCDVTWDLTGYYYQTYLMCTDGTIRYPESDTAHVNWQGEGNYCWESYMVANTPLDVNLYRYDASKDIETCTHDWGNYTVKSPATCRQNEYGVYTCSKCGKLKGVTVERDVEHSWDAGKVVTEPTYSETGLKVATCTVCGNFKETVLDKLPTQAMYRLYNKYTGDHLFTTDKNEYDSLVKGGWTGENKVWNCPKTGSDAQKVYRLYNPYSGDHHYTSNVSEYNSLMSIGWNGEGLKFYSAENTGQPIYRLFNPWLKVGTHLYTTDVNEYNKLASFGWQKENIAFYGVK